MSQEKKRLSIIIPAYNEAQNLKMLLPRFTSVLKEMQKSGFQTDMAVVNDGSSDETAEIASAAGLTVISHPFNLGYSAAVHTGFMHAMRSDSDLLLTIDADGQHNPEDILLLVSDFLQHPVDLLIGSRFLEDRGYRKSLLRFAGITLFSKIIRLVTGAEIRDVTSGFRLYGKRALRYLAKNFPQDYPEYETLIILLKTGCKIKELPLSMNQRLYGTSMHSSWKAVVYPFKNLLIIFVVLLRTLHRKGEATP
ncbi:MAG: glycosyltransferase family 2 protein [candidate division KSB1 bacterium]|nr:glycosyltransferase family 2 protein [candidate division KSB1 bacterium]